MYIGSVALVKRGRVVDETGIHYPLIMFTITARTLHRTRIITVPINEHNASVLGKVKIREGMFVRFDGELNAFLANHDVMFMMRLTYFEPVKKQKGAKI